MKLIHYIFTAVAVLALASCGDFNDRLDGFDDNDYKPTDVKELTIELKDADYEKIASLAKDNDLKANKYFATDNDAADYIPAWLKSCYPTADNGSTAKVTYKVVKVQMPSYAMGADADNDIELTDNTAPFELIGKEWKYNPSVTLTLPNEKGNPVSKVFYNRITAWVNRTYDEPNGFDMFNPGGYLNLYGDTEYFSGCTYYNNRVEWIAADAKSNTPSVYGAMSDEEVVATMQHNLTITFGESLKEAYEDAEPVEGMEVTYTVNFMAYMEGKKLVPYTIKYLLTGKGDFTYVEGSLKPAK